MKITNEWWGDSVGYCKVRWPEVSNVICQIRNSHDEDDIIEMEGNRAVPDELIGIRATENILGKLNS